MNINQVENQSGSEKKVYTVKEVAELLDLKLRSAYNFCNTTNDFIVLRINNSIRINKESFDHWLCGGSPD